MARKQKRKSTDQAPGWVWMLFGLSVGLVVALVVYLQSGDAAIGIAQPQAAAAERAQTGESAARAASAASAATDPGSSSAAATDAEEEFSFFRLLPESEVVVPASGSAVRSAAGPAPGWNIRRTSARSWLRVPGSRGGDFAKLSFLPRPVTVDGFQEADYLSPVKPTLPKLTIPAH
jgi:hypothetical protein